jgi:hypothetical protein
MKNNTIQERARQRNITPNFLRFKRKIYCNPGKSNGTSIGKK